EADDRAAPGRLAPAHGRNHRHAFRPRQRGDRQPSARSRGAPRPDRRAAPPVRTGAAGRARLPGHAAADRLRQDAVAAVHRRTDGASPRAPAGHERARGRHRPRLPGGGDGGDGRASVQRGDRGGVRGSRGGALRRARPCGGGPGRGRHPRLARTCAVRPGAGHRRRARAARGPARTAKRGRAAGHAAGRQGRAAAERGREGRGGRGDHPQPHGGPVHPAGGDEL
ncbi:MAG: Protein-L-isoaspartate O-methyltransferase, partial [uncultured Sphingomonas sp.]